MDIRFQSCSWHRNGVGGEGFYVVLFDWNDDGQTRHMVAVYRPKANDDGDLDEFSPDCAVLDLVESLRGNIKMAEGNSWRGDRFEPEIRRYVLDYQKKQDEDYVGGS